MEPTRYFAIGDTAAVFSNYLPLADDSLLLGLDDDLDSLCASINNFSKLPLYIDCASTGGVTPPPNSTQSTIYRKYTMPI